MDQPITNTDVGTQPYTFKIRFYDELQGHVRAKPEDPKSREQILEMLHTDMNAMYPGRYEIVEFREVSEEEWQEAEQEATLSLLEFEAETPRTLN